MALACCYVQPSRFPTSTTMDLRLRRRSTNLTVRDGAFPGTLFGVQIAGEPALVFWLLRGFQRSKDVLNAHARESASSQERRLRRQRVQVDVDDIDLPPLIDLTADGCVALCYSCLDHFQSAPSTDLRICHFLY